MKKLPTEEEIRASLRALTAESRKVRKELEEMIRRPGPGPLAFSHDRRYRTKLPPADVVADRPPPRTESRKTATKRKKK